MKKTVLLIAGLCMISTVWSQELKQILDSALKHPFLEAQQKNIEIQQKLVKTSFNLAPTNIDYAFGSINEVAVMDYSLIINQGFYLPYYYRRQNELLQSGVSVQETQYLIQKNDFIRDVKLAYYQLSFEQASLNQYHKLDSIYEKMEVIIKKQLELGEIDFIVKANFIMESQKIHLQAEETEMSVKIALSHLQQFLPNKMDTIDTSPLSSLSFTKQENNTSPFLKLSEQQVLQQEKVVNAAKNEMAITWKAGYTNKLLSNHIVSEYLVGANIPIIHKAQKARIQAQEIAYQKSLLNHHAIQMQLDAKIEQAYQKYLKYEESVVFYENKALPVMKQLIETSKRKYKKGEIDFLTYAQNHQRSIELELNYLEMILQLNQSVVELEYLTGNLQN